jgi:hypothetical protein
MSATDSLKRRSIVTAMGALGLAAATAPLKLSARDQTSAPDVLAFGLIESVLDLRSLRPLFQRVFGKPELVDDWFGETILYSETATITNTFVPFEQLAAGGVPDACRSSSRRGR